MTIHAYDERGTKVAAFLNVEHAARFVRTMAHHNETIRYGKSNIIWRHGEDNPAALDPARAMSHRIDRILAGELTKQRKVSSRNVSLLTGR